MARNPQRVSATRARTARAVETSWRTKAENVELAAWYASEDAKRSFGNLCRAVHVQAESLFLLGSEHRPLAVLLPAEEIQATQFEVPISIDEAKADWSSVTAAVLLLGTVFRISGSNYTHAVFKRHHINRHSALRYRRPQLEDIPQNVSMLLDDLKEVSGQFANTTALIDCRFKEVWRGQNL